MDDVEQNKSWNRETVGKSSENRKKMRIKDRKSIKKNIQIKSLISIYQVHIGGLIYRKIYFYNCINKLLA